jgi:hypothetical protein
MVDELEGRMIRIFLPGGFNILPLLFQLLRFPEEKQSTD